MSKLLVLNATTLALGIDALAVAASNDCMYSEAEFVVFGEISLFDNGQLEPDEF
jgi:hypothetical protein